MLREKMANVDQMFSPGIWWIGFRMNRSGSKPPSGVQCFRASSLLNLMVSDKSGAIQIGQRLRRMNGPEPTCAFSYDATTQLHQTGHWCVAQHFQVASDVTADNPVT